LFGRDVENRIHLKNIDKFAKLEKEKNKVKNIALQNNGWSKYWQIHESVKLHWCYKGLDFKYLSR
jgi:hypothetical protein